RATTVISDPGFSEAETNLDRPRCAKNVIGPMSTVAITSGHTPPAPAFIGRNRTPAPTAVPNSERAQLFSKRRRLRPLPPLSISVCSLVVVLWSGSVGSCDIATLHFLRIAEHHVPEGDIIGCFPSCPMKRHSCSSGRVKPWHPERNVGSDDEVFLQFRTPRYPCAEKSLSVTSSSPLVFWI